MGKNVFIYSGQGCQYYNMGRSTWNQNTLFRQNMQRIDSLIKNKTGISVEKILYEENKRGEFDDLKKAHLSIFAFQYCVTETLKQYEIYPDIVMGSSLGEYCAATTAGIFDLNEMINCLHQQVNIVLEKAPKGRMISVFSNIDLFEDKSIFLDSELVAINHMRNFTISAKTETMDAVIQNLKRNRIGMFLLPVKYPFHSSCIEVIREDIVQLFEKMKRNKSNCVIMSGLKGERVEEMDSKHCWDIIRNPICINKCFEKLDKNECTYIDLSPTGEMKVALSLLYSNKKTVYNLFSRFSNQNIFDETVTKIKLEKEKSMKAYVFPGQGSQEKGMGKDLFKEFKELTESANTILGYSIEDLCLNDPENKLQNTEYTQPAIYVVSAFDYLKSLNDGESKPDFVAGHSVGEYAALFAAGAFDFETGLKLVKKRGELMAKANGGAMAAIIGLTREQVLEVIKNNNMSGIDVANYNGVKQIVISGVEADIQTAEKVFLEVEGCRNYVKLKVSGAFHSRYMENAMKEFEKYVSNFKFNEIKIPVISNRYARPYVQKNLVDTLTKQIVSPVQWTDSIRYLMGLGVENITQKGPGNVAANLVKRIQKEATPLCVDKEELDQREKEINAKEDNEPKMKVSAYELGSKTFVDMHHVKYPYVVGGMYKGISGVDLVVTCAKAGIMSFYGTGGQNLSIIKNDIATIMRRLENNESFGVNVISNFTKMEKEEKLIDLLIEYNIHNIEAAAYISISKSLVKYRLKGISKDANNNVVIKNRIFAKVSRPEVATRFMSPPPKNLINQLLEEKQITEEEASLGMGIPMADNITVEADSAGHTDRGNAYCLMPAMICLRDRIQQEYTYTQPIHIGAAGGIGTPQTAAAAFVLGADYIVTGSINQCTVEANISDLAKELLNDANVQDMEYAPAGDLFESGSIVQVLKKGSLFSMRAKKLYSLYSGYNSISEIDEKTLKKLEKDYFNRTIAEVYQEVQKHHDEETIQNAKKNSKARMALIFRWYFAYSTQNALDGDALQKSNMQIQCGPALGAFNQYVIGTKFSHWKNRHVDEIGIYLLEKTKDYFYKIINGMERTL